jgi:plasmid maintenance system antidote protein VapI
MNSFEFDVSEKEIAGAEHVSRVGRLLVAAFVRKCRNEGITKKALADRLGVDKSVISRMLSGHANLTLKSVGELVWALDHDIEVAVAPVFDEQANVARILVGNMQEGREVGQRQAAGGVGRLYAVTNTNSSGPVRAFTFPPTARDGLVLSAGSDARATPAKGSA